MKNVHPIFTPALEAMCKPIPTDGLSESLKTLESIMNIPERPLQPPHREEDFMERDDYLGDLHDRADDQQAQDFLNRERELSEALDEAKAKGVCVENLKVLARESGATQWALHQSLEGV